MFLSRIPPSVAASAFMVIVLLRFSAVCSMGDAFPSHLAQGGGLCEAPSAQ